METQLSAFGGEKKRQKSESVDPTVEKKGGKKAEYFPFVYYTCHRFRIISWK